MKWTKKRVEALLLLVVVLIVIMLPLYARTGSYPLTIVNGNSMYPNLQNGDLVFYKATNTAHIANGTVIVLVQSGTDDSLLSNFIRPVVIHRIVGEVIQSDGTVCYQTKGDNNDDNDPFLTKPAQVLGVTSLTLPKVGLLFLFLQSPQGLIATVGIISLAYLGMQDMKRKEDKKKDKFLGALAKKVISGDISNEVFEKIQLTVKYSDEIEASDLEDSSLMALADWLKKDGLDQDWKLTTAICTECSGIAIEIEGERPISITLCPKCNKVKVVNINADLAEKETIVSLLSSKKILSQ
jgi:signal peptidase